ncbi:hypothetical protein BH10PSE16_BH10PSE16_04740 [soil metagenome]
MAEIEEDDELGGLDASNATDHKILRTVLLINLGQGSEVQWNGKPG